MQNAFDILLYQSVEKSAQFHIFLSAVQDKEEMPIAVRSAGHDPISALLCACGLTGLEGGYTPKI